MRVKPILLFALLAPGSAHALTLARAPYVQLASHDSILVAWRTDEPSDGAVEYGLDATYGSRASDPATAPVTQHAVVLAGLEPGTRYLYRVLGGGTVLAEGKGFVTDSAPGSAEPYRFVAFGDSGGGTQAQLDVAARIALSAPDFAIHIGDIAYPGGIPADLDRLYFDVYRDTISGAVFYTALGNKDVESDGGAAVLDAFYLPGNSPQPERYYSLVRGNALFIALDTNRDAAPGSEQHAWLEAELARSDSFWKIVFFHHPLYTSARGEFIPRASLEPLLNEHRVDLVFQGHTHFYERTFPIEDGAVTDAAQEPDYVDPRGTVYVVTGGGGGTLVTASPKSFSARYKSTYHHVLVAVEDDKLTLTAIDSTGQTIDAMTIRKTKEPPPPPLFHRGDADANGELQLTDAIRILGFLFLGSAGFGCLEAADADDSGQLQLTDAIRVLNFLFTGGDPPPAPGPPPAPCGADPQGSPGIGCDVFEGC